jgi:regulator of PEP synthase PpsR (kinase-PPPase family)
VVLIATIVAELRGGVSWGDQAEEATMSRLAVYVVSGGTGTSGEQLARTALAQFPQAELPVITRAQVHDAEQLEAAVAEVVATGGIMVNTLVDHGLRQQLAALAEGRDVVVIDALGPLLEELSRLLGREWSGTPGAYRRLREAYFRRIEAIEFAVAHDDGRNTHELDQAEAVLAGVSRVGKTPLCMYLAMLGWKAANVPLVQGVDPPRQLYEIDRNRVIGLTITPDKLRAHRRERQQTLGEVGRLSYAGAREISQDLEYAYELYRRSRFATVDTSDKPIEESATEVIALIQRGSTT